MHSLPQSDEACPRVPHGGVAAWAAAKAKEFGLQTESGSEALGHCRGAGDWRGPGCAAAGPALPVRIV